jgi:hypothetical protein
MDASLVEVRGAQRTPGGQVRPAAERGAVDERETAVTVSER